MNEQKKEWRTIEEAPKYEVSNYGDVRNKKKGTEIKGSVDKDGYPRVLITNKEGKRVTRFRHRLAAIAFLPNPNNLPQVNHKDENKANSFVGTAENNYTDGNLEWCTAKYNNNYGTRIQRLKLTMEDNAKKINYGHLNGIPVFVYSKDRSTFIGQYPSIRSAAMETGSDYRSVYKVLYKEREATNDLYFSFEKIEELDKEEK